VPLRPFVIPPPPWSDRYEGEQEGAVIGVAVGHLADGSAMRASVVPSRVARWLLIVLLTRLLGSARWPTVRSSDGRSGGQVGSANRPRRRASYV